MEDLYLFQLKGFGSVVGKLGKSDIVGDGVADDTAAIQKALNGTLSIREAIQVLTVNGPQGPLLMSFKLGDFEPCAADYTVKLMEGSHYATHYRDIMSKIQTVPAGGIPGNGKPIIDLSRR